MLKAEDIKIMLTWNKGYSYHYQVRIPELDSYDADPKIKQAWMEKNIFPDEDFDFTEEGEKKLLQYAEKCLNFNLYISIEIRREYQEFGGDGPLASSFKIFPEMPSYIYDSSNPYFQYESHNDHSLYTKHGDTCEWTGLKYDWFNQLPKPRINAAYDIKNKLDDILLKKHGLKITEDYKNDSLFS